ncbi:carbohydrate ABC transporter permease [Geochorda subterranea]|uniref:Sugar ABC transporter permease n=1 Tax=Geochorda subterranea TaxID=3109564 RepID=A0ABZ1BLH2_9FIRM|nr:sugar ABC transporter permease [Limnochorda sp. LNt]WRP13674.1 sugar ABC transporter permease [Limnochorda sp. LNt]
MAPTYSRPRADPPERALPWLAHLRAAVRLARRREWYGVPYVLPLLLYLGVLLLYPLGYVVYLSLHDVNLLSMASRWVGLDNYRWAFEFEMPGSRGVYFTTSLLRSLGWVALSLSLKVSLGLAGAVLLSQPTRLGRLYQAVTILPWGLPWAIAAMIWAWSYNTQFGFVNGILRLAGLVEQPVAFLGTPVSAFVSTAVADAWIGLPFMVVMILAGLRSVPPEVLDAALVDGASPWQRWVRVTLPLVLPVILTTALLSTVWTFNSYDPIWVMTRGGPLGATETLPIAVYNVGFRQLRIGGIGRAAAMTVMQVLLVSIIAWLYLRMLRRSQQQAG